tara:strand:- start:260 stop:634 length:375 start_codon:yes stop_codon:yes gene_type:complete
MKKYLNIREVSKLLDIKEHVIRYWDSVDPKTNKIRVEGISTKSNGGTRYFNRENVGKLRNLKNLLYENGTQNPSLVIANKILKDKSKSQILHISPDQDIPSITREKAKKIDQILQNIRIILKKS